MTSGVDILIDKNVKLWVLEVEGITKVCGNHIYDKLVDFMLRNAK